MGLLDEAIRDHLELKRQRGADPNQVAREEQEALGPAVRRPAEGDAEVAEAAEAAEPAPATSQETAPFDAEDLFADEDVQVEEPGPQPGEAEGEDVLEETPEFLQ